MRNLKITTTLSLVAALLMVSACSPESTDLVSQKPIVIPESEKGQDVLVGKQKLDWITVDGGEGALDFNPNLDILFVSDNSDSMKSAQANVLKNLQLFTRGITKYEMIDYQVGVISVWDSKERSPEAPKFNPGAYGIGELHYIKDANGKQYTNDGKRFITRQTRHLLASTLNVGVASYKNGGPETEEFFSPLEAALTKTGRGAANEGFFREDSLLVVIFLTDADDSSPSIDAKAMASVLKKFKGGDSKKPKLLVYGVLVDKSDKEKSGNVVIKDYGLHVDMKNNPQCFEADGSVKAECKGGLGPVKLEELITLANPTLNRTAEQIKAENILKITSRNFGAELGIIGDKITAETLRKEIVLPQRPLMYNGQLNVEVFYGNQKIPYSAKGGWSYDQRTQTVVLDGNIDYKYQKGAKFVVRMIPEPQPK